MYDGLLLFPRDNSGVYETGMEETWSGYRWPGCDGGNVPACSAAWPSIIEYGPDRKGVEGWFPHTSLDALQPHLPQAQTGSVTGAATVSDY